jgi:uracil-DNA glycosylase
VQVIVALGQIAHQACLRALEASGVGLPSPRPRFGHGQVACLQEGLVLLASYHPSQQNTQTGRLTDAMFQQIFQTARRQLDAHAR